MRSETLGVEGRRSAGGQREFPRGLQIGFWICVVIALAAVGRRVAALVSPPKSVPPALAALDAVFASHRALTLAHILPAAAFVILAPFALSRQMGARPTLERAFFALGLVVGVTAYAMSWQAVGGWVELSAVLVFNTIFLASLGRSFVLWRQNALASARWWLIRAVAVLLGIATTRPVMGVFFATSPKTHLTPEQFFGIAFWIGFGINTMVIEFWLRYGAGRMRREGQEESHDKRDA